MSGDVLERPRDRSVPANHDGRSFEPPSWSLSSLALFAVATRFFDDSPRVERIRFDNPSEYDIHVAVSAPRHDGALRLGFAGQRCVTEFHEVIDQGPTWLVTFRAQGRAVAMCPSPAMNSPPRTGSSAFPTR
jgi:hypothetical protein